MSGPLSAEALALLDFLCAAEASRCRVKTLKARTYLVWNDLNTAGLVKGFRPQPWAMADWLKRQQSPKRRQNYRTMSERASQFEAERIGRENGLTLKASRKLTPEQVQELAAKKSLVEPVQETPAEPEPTVAEVPNEPPSAPTPISGAELAEQLRAWCAQSGASITRLAFHIFRSNSGIRHLSESKVPLQRTVDRVNAFLADPILPSALPLRGGAKPRAPKINPVPIQRDDRKNHRMVQAYRARTQRQAKAILSGEKPMPKHSNAALKGALNELRDNEAAAHRASDPIEQAKLKVQRAGYACFSAIVVDGERKGKGHWYIGRRRVSTDELLKFAEVRGR